MTAFLTSFALVGLAEMADKTQLLTLCLACRYPARKVLIGIAIAIAILNLLAVTVGALVGALLPETPVKVAAGCLFIGFGLWSLLGRDDDDEEETCDTSGGRSAILAIAFAFFIAEMGDKTQLAVFSLAARFDAYLGVWLGATLGLLAANALAIGGGVVIGNRLPQKTVRKASGVLFIVFGVWTLADALL